MRAGAFPACRQVIEFAWLVSRLVASMDVSSGQKDQSQLPVDKGACEQRTIRGIHTVFNGFELDVRISPPPVTSTKQMRRQLE